MRRWVFFALAMMIGLVCIRLGIWQLSRLAERRAHNAEARSQLELPQVVLPQALSAEGAPAYRKAHATGVFDPDHEIYLTSRSHEGIAGVHVVTPLRLGAEEPALLVDRGWISDSDFRTLPRERWTASGSTEVEGLLLPSQHEPALSFLADRLPAPGAPPLTEWRALSIPDVRHQIPYPILGVYLAQTGSPMSSTAPIPDPDLDLSEGPHLGYAVQWFAFATIAIVGGLLWLQRMTRGSS